MVEAGKYDNHVTRWLDATFGQDTGIILLGLGASICIAGYIFFQRQHRREPYNEDRTDD